MAASLSGLVNQHLFHAKLLLEIADSLTDESFKAAKIAALENSAVVALERTVNAFVLEVADSCQVKEGITDLHSLDAALNAEGRSHAVVSSLVELSQNPSWLSELEQQSLSLVSKSPNITKHSNQMIALSEASMAMDIGQMIEECEAFITTQREFLQEW